MSKTHDEARGTPLKDLLNDDDEVVVHLRGEYSWSLRSGSSTRQSGDYVRLCSPDGSEKARWGAAAFEADPRSTMRALLDHIAEYTGAGEIRDKELVAVLADGSTVHGGTGTAAGEYVRLCEGDGTEVLYYDSTEWQQDAVEVVGAFLNACAGSRLEFTSPGDKESDEPSM